MGMARWAHACTSTRTNAHVHARTRAREHEPTQAHPAPAPAPAPAPMCMSNRACTHAHMCTCMRDITTAMLPRYMVMGRMMSALLHGLARLLLPSRCRH